MSGLMQFKLNVKRIGILAVAAMLVAACSNSRKAGKGGVVLDTMTVNAKNNPYNTYRAASTKLWEIVHTKAALSFNLQEKTAVGMAWLTLHPYFYSADSLVLDAKGMKINEVTDGRAPLQYNYKDDKLFIRLPKKYSKADTLHVYVKYTAMPYAEVAGGSSAINEDRGLYFINTDNAVKGKPAQIWTQGETEASSHWVPTIDKPNQRTTTQLALTIPDSFISLSNGHLSSQYKEANGMRTDVWKMDKPIQVYAMMFAIGRFDIVKDDNWNDKEVNYYVEPEFAPYAKYMFARTPQMIDYFSKVTGVPYPWNKYSQIVVRDYVSGAMENTSASLFGSFMNKNKRQMDDGDNDNIVSHELFHQWFGDYVTAESWSNLTVNESFATYGEQLWRKYKYGQASADELWHSEWESYLNSKNNSPLLRYYYADKEDMFDRVSYQKGSLILHYLHELMGDEAFSAAMKMYLTDNALKSAEVANWRLAVESVTGQDWNWFFNQWYNRGAHPKLSIEYLYNDVKKELQLTVSQMQKNGLYELPCKTAIIDGDEKRIVDWNIKDKVTTFIYSYKNGIRPVVLPDVYHRIPAEIEEIKTPADWLAAFKKADSNVITKVDILEHAIKIPNDESCTAILTAALEDKSPFVKQRALQLMAGIKSEKLQDKLKAQVAFVSREGDRRVRAAAINTTVAWNNEWRVDPDVPLFNNVNDSSYMVSAAWLRLINQYNKDTAYAYAKRLLPTHPRGDLMDAVMEMIGASAKDEDIQLFEDATLEYDDRITMASVLSTYMQKVRSDKSFERALSLLEKLVRSESIQRYRSATGLYIMEAANYYRDQRNNVSTNVEKENAMQRLDKLKAAAEKMIAEEPSEDNKVTYRNYMKTVFR